MCERVFRDWLRGVSERTLAKMHRMRRPLVEEVVREQAQAMARRLRSACRLCRGSRGDEFAGSAGERM